jgi:ligand-binding sensor domain-containing protein
MTQMLTELRASTAQNADDSLKNLSCDHHDNFAIALMKSWAVIGDILTFYQERIAQEGFLMSATEQRSWHYLARRVGVKPSTGVAASAMLSFSVKNAPGIPDSVIIPKQTSIQSVPDAGQLPVTFETSKSIHAKAAWNAVNLDIPENTQPIILNSNDTELRLQGVSTGLKPGSWIFMSNGSSENSWALCTIEQVELNRKQGFTLIRFKVQVTSAINSTPSEQSFNPAVLPGSFTNPQVLSIAQQAKLFGQQAPLWSKLTAAQRQAAGPYISGVFKSSHLQNPWQALLATFPKASFDAIAMDGETLYATSNGILYRYQTALDGWTQLQSNLLRKKIGSLHVDTRAYLYIGTIDGSVLRSTDQGNTWDTITGQLQLDQHFLKAVQNTTLPVGPIRTLLTIPKNNSETLLIGTDNGLFATDFDFEWISLNQNLPGYNAKTKLAELSILCLTWDEKQKTLYIGSNSGLFRSKDFGKSWTALNSGLFKPAATSLLTHIHSQIDKRKTSSQINTLPLAKRVNSICSYTSQNKHSLFAGTDVGLFRSLDNGSSWERLFFESENSVVAVFSLIWKAAEAGQNTSGTLLVGSQLGLFCSQDDGKTWTLTNLPYCFDLDPSLEPDLNEEMLTQAVREIFVKQNIALSATATPHCLETNLRWEIADPDASLYFKIEKSNNRLVVSADQGFSTSVINAIADNGQGEIALIATQSPSLTTEWPHFQIENNHLDLDRVYPHIASGNWVILHQAAPMLLTGAYRITQVSQCNQSAYSITALVTRLSLDLTEKAMGSPDLSEFNLRDTQVLLNSQSLPLYTQRPPLFIPAQGKAIYTAADTPPFSIGQKLLITGQPISLSLVGDLGGLFALASTTQSWNAVGLQNQDVFSIIADPGGNLFAATDHGIFRQTAQSTVWISITNSLSNLQSWFKTIQCQIAINTDTLLAGSAEGLYCWKDDQWQTVPLAKKSTESVLCFAHDAKKTIYAGCASGTIYQLLTGQTEWEVLCRISCRVMSISVGSKPNSPIFVGTDGKGVFQIQGQAYKAWNVKLSNLNVQALVQDSEGYLYAGTSGGGVFRSPVAQSDWSLFNKGLLTFEVKALALDTQNKLYCGTRGGGIYKTERRSPAWNAYPIGLSNDINALWITPENRVLAGSQRQSILTGTSDLTNKVLRPDCLAILPLSFVGSLDQENIMSDLHLALARQQMDLPPTTTIQVIEKCKCWLLSSSSNVSLTPPGTLTSNANLPQISLLQEDVLGNNTAKTSTNSTPVNVLIRNNGTELICFNNLSLSVLSAPTTVGGSYQNWLLSTSAGFCGNLLTSKTDVFYQPTIATSLQTEEATVLNCVLDTLPSDLGAGKVLRISLDEALSTLYDPNTVTICGNSVEATHGQTVAFEVLGSGDGSKINQSMKLHQPPLTYVSAPTAEGGVSTLTVVVNDNAMQNLPQLANNPLALTQSGVEWEEVPCLSAAGPESRHYMVKIDDSGNASVLFGDGLQGARLPSGRENIIASYRSGLGCVGNVAAGKLTLLKNRPAGLQGVTNPLPATGGVDPGITDSNRLTIGKGLQTFSRIVSLSDYQNFAQNFPGISKAQMTLVNYGKGKMLHLTIAALDGSLLASGNATFDSLNAAIIDNRAYPKPFVMDSYRSLYFEIAAHCLIRAGLDKSALQTQIEQKLKSAFSFNAMAFGQSIPVSFVTKEIQDIPGVVSVSITAFHLTGESPAYSPLLLGSQASWNASTKQFIPAGILLLNPQPQGLRLVIEEMN